MEATNGPEDPPPVWADADDSSFSDTGSEWEDEPAVGPAGLSGQGVEGATFSGAPRVALPPDAHAGGPSAPPPHQPPVRDTAWRTYRRSLEWRCRWVELRLRELKAQEAHYAALEARLLARQAGGGSGGEAGAAADGQAAETAAAADTRDERRWRRRLRRTAAAGEQASSAACLDHLVAPLTAPPPPVVPVPAGDDGSDSDCGTARVFDSVAAVQLKVAHLYRQLSAYRAASGLPPAPPRRQHTVRLAAVVPSHHHQANGNGRLGGGQGGAQGYAPAQAGPTLRRASDPGGGPQAMSRRERERGGGGMEFDINDVVGALGVATKVVEKAAHVDIATPGVRKAQLAPWEGLSDARAAANALAAAQAAADKAALAKAARKASGGGGDGQPGAGGSSSEDTSDEAYMALHTAMENQEKAWRLLPSLPGRGSGAVARGEKQAAATAAAAANGGAPALDESSPHGDGDDEQALDSTTPTAAAAALLKGTPRAGTACAAVAEWTITRGEGARRQHVLSLKRTELL